MNPTEPETSDDVIERVIIQLVLLPVMVTSLPPMVAVGVWIASLITRDMVTKFPGVDSDGLYVLFDTNETEVAAGTIPSTTIALFAASEPVESGEKSIRLAGFLATSLIVPPFKSSAVVSV